MNSCLKHSLVILSAVILTACSLVPQRQDNGQPALSSSEAQTRYQQGLASYRTTNFEAALKDLGAATSSGRLKASDEVNARKHMAFIHCISGREMQCREQFQIITQLDPKFDLAPNEAGHPAWGPVWRSTKGASEEQRAIKQAGGLLSSTAQNKLADGIRQYDDGRYKEALDLFQGAIKTGFANRADEIRAHKYSAYVYCLTKRTALCRGEFRKIFSIDPGFEMLPSESGHPAWASIYQKEKATAAKHTKKRG